MIIRSPAGGEVNLLLHHGEAGTQGSEPPDGQARRSRNELQELPAPVGVEGGHGAR